MRTEVGCAVGGIWCEDVMELRHWASYYRIICPYYLPYPTGTLSKTFKTKVYSNKNYMYYGYESIATRGLPAAALDRQELTPIDHSAKSFLS